MSYLTTPGLVVQKVQQGALLQYCTQASHAGLAYSCVSTVSWTSDSS
jgi:hypothetical protein